MTRQELFNKVVEGLASQGFERSVGTGANGGEVCHYHGPNGLRCAVGWLIPDDEYDPLMEHMSPRQGRVAAAAGITMENELLALALQYAHDSVTSPAHVRDRLREVAVHFNLTIPDVLVEPRLNKDTSTKETV